MDRNTAHMYEYILGETYIEDDCISLFHEILTEKTEFRPRSVYDVSMPDLLEQVQPLSRERDHLQLMFRAATGDGSLGNMRQVGHWVCLHYVAAADELRVYDSLYSDLTDIQMRYVSALLPHGPNVVFPAVQRQTNAIDCGVFAVAFATCVAIGINPSGINFIIGDMRQHMFFMLNTREISAFPRQEGVQQGGRKVGRPRGRHTTNQRKIKNLKKDEKRLQRTQESLCLKEVSNAESENWNSDLTYSSATTPVLLSSKSTSLKPKMSMDVEEKRRKNRERKRLSRAKVAHENPERMTEQKKKDSNAHKLARENINYREKERRIDASAHKIMRENINYREKERRIDASAHKIMRENINYRENERRIDASAHKTMRENLNYREKEKKIDANAHKIMRENIKYREKERKIDSSAHKIMRENINYREKERKTDAKAHIILRNNAEFRDKEKERDLRAHRAVRENLEYRRDEQNRDTMSRKNARQNQDYRDTERLRDSETRRTARLDLDYAAKEKSRRTSRINTRKELENNDWNKIKESFFERIIEGNTNICECCGRLWYKTSIKHLNKTQLKEKNYGEDFLDKVFYFRQVEKGMFCHTCYKNIMLGKVPRLAMYNGLVYPDIPQVLKDLTPLEERLVSPRHIFIKLVRRGQGIGYQHGLVGNVVNVPVQIDTMVGALPRQVTDDNVITVELKRMAQHKSGRKERIRPQKVREAAQYLVSTELFRELGIKYDDSWHSDHSDSEHSDEDSSAERNKEAAEEVEEPLNPGVTETLLDDVTISMAPGEASTPLSLLYDEHVEALGFIKVHGGQKRNLKIKLTHSDIIKSEITRYDRRAMRPDYLFTALKKQQMSAIRANIGVCLRKKTLYGAPILAGNLLEQDFIPNLIQHDDGYKVLAGIRNSPAHWESEKRKLLAMIRQFGVPTLFITLSAAETRWPELLVLLKKSVDGEEIDHDQARQLSYEDKSRLVQSDPFVCATFFEKRFKELKRTWSSEMGPFGNYKIDHFYHRIEFQHRGSPHAHMMLWLTGAPVYVPGDSDSVASVVEFVDSIIACSSDEMPDYLIDLQRHKHTRTCHPKPNRPCRFGIPFFPMDQTRLLLEIDKEDISRAQWQKTAKSLKEKIDNIPDHITTFDDFLSFVDLSLDQYIMAVRGSLTKPKIFLKRSPKDVFINPYAQKILQLQQANMDIQYILDPFACSVYIVDYINKADRGMSNLLHAAVEESKRGNMGVKESLRAIANVFLNSSEISAQEAIYCLASLPLSRASESDIYINTAHPNNRVHILKRQEELRNLDPNSEEIFQHNIVDHYANRPKDDIFDAMSLAFFAAYYTYSQKKPTSNTHTEENDDDELADGMDGEETVGNWVKLLNNDGFVRKRTKPKIIRFRRYDRLQDPDNFYREQLMLYTPWRNEQIDLLEDNINVQSLFENCIDKIKTESLQFNRFGGDEEFNILINAIREAERESEDGGDTGAGARRGEDNHPLEQFELETQIGDIDDDEVRGGAGGGGPNNNGAVGVIAQPAILSEDDVLNITRLLNEDQRDFLLHIGHYFSTKVASTEPLFAFVCGGAGVGKSLLIKAIFQYLTVQHFNREAGSNPDDLKILLCAYTGKAAFGIGGQTVHSAFGLPISQCGVTMPELSASTANTLACKLANIQLIILDEISMLGSRTFHQIDKRLRQIFKTNIPFAGRSIIAVGDFRQLPPVGDNWIFQPNNRNPMAILAGAQLWEPFKLFEMNQIMRQRDDLLFATALNNMASGAMMPEDIALIESRCYRSQDLPAEANGAIHLFASNREVDVYNAKVLSSMESLGAIVNAIDVVTGAPNEIAKKKAIKSVNALPTAQTFGLPKSISLKIGARYMITVNIDTSDGLVNGTTGILKEIEFGRHKDTGDRRALRLWFSFGDENIGRAARRKVPHRVHRERNDGEQCFLTPLESSYYIIKRWKSSNLQIRRTQFPIVPAEGITIHKSQGATLEKVVVHVTQNVRRSMLYVACSRATSSAGLFIVSPQAKFIAPKPPTDINPVVREMERLHQNALQPIFRFLKSIPCGVYQIIFHNVQSLRKHAPDVAVDPAINISNFLFFVETWSCTSDNFPLQDFVQVVRIDGPSSTGANRGWGSLAYARKTDWQQQPNCDRYCEAEPGQGHCECIGMAFHDILLISVYRSPKCSVNTAIGCIDHALRKNIYGRVILFGDFNVNFTNNSDNSFTKYFEMNGIKSCLAGPTTRDRTQIDNVFSNMHIEVGTLESFFSHHKEIWIRFAV